MRRILLDTSIYGRIIENLSSSALSESVKGTLLKESVVIYGIDTIRKELRSVSIKTSISRKARLRLLSAYDILTAEHTIMATEEMEELGAHYYSLYRELGGSLGKREMENDFLIVAAATIKEMDIVYSDDQRSMVSEAAMKSYTLVNGIRKYKTPRFENYASFMREIKRSP
jgi:hypothetical protein